VAAAAPATTTALVASPLAADREPRWSEPSAPAEGATSALDALGSKDDARRNSKKGNERRDSVPPAS
jgi:hypothetical protein